jgi:hypothetical protein
MIMAVSNAAGICTTDAVRRSVSRTGGGVTDSVVTSVTKNLRLAYNNVECNISDIGPVNL